MCSEPHAVRTRNLLPVPPTRLVLIDHPPKFSLEMFRVVRRTIGGKKRSRVADLPDVGTAKTDICGG